MAIRTLMQDIIHKQKGFTLTEVMIATAVIGVLAMVGTSLVAQVYKAWRLSEARVLAQQNARTILNLVERRLRQASADTVVIDRHNVSDPPYSKITFTSQNGDTYEFRQNSDLAEMQRTLAGGGGTQSRQLSKNVRYLSFSYASSTNDRLVNVAICMEVPTYAGETKDFYMTLQKIQIQNL